MMEENLRRALLIGRGNPMVFLESPISAGILSLCAALLILMVVMPFVRASNTRRKRDVQM